MAGRRATRAGTTAAVDLRPQGRTRSRQQKFHVGQSGEGETRFLRPRMITRHDQHEVLVEEVGSDDLVAGQGEGDDGQVQLAGAELDLELHAGALRHIEVDVRVTGPQQVEELRHQPAAGGADHAQAHRADHFLAQGHHVGHHVGELAHDPAGPFDHDVALLGQVARGPVDQLDLQLTLEAGDMGRDVGLNRPDRRRGRREAPGVGNAHEVLADVSAPWDDSFSTCLQEFSCRSHYKIVSIS